jgi:hypothetical protein
MAGRAYALYAAGGAGRQRGRFGGGVGQRGRRSADTVGPARHTAAVS